jgi:hypothetical protein
MGNYYAGDMLYGDLISSKGLDPDRPTNDVDAYEVLVKLEKVIADRFAGAARDQVRRELEMARLGLKLYESNNNTRAKLAETRGRDARAVTAALTSRRNSIEKNRAYVQSRLNASPDMRKVDSAYATGGVNGAVTALVNLRDERGATIDSNHPAVHGYMDRFVRTVTRGKQGIEDIDPATFTGTLAGLDPTLATQLEPLLVGGKQSINSLKSAQVELSNNLAKVSEGLGIAGGASVPQATLDKLVQDEILRNDDDAALVERLLGRSAADYEIEKQVLVENDAEYRRLLDLEESMRARVLGGAPGTGDKIGRIVATPVFQQWAESNGFRLGNSRIVDGKVEYIPGADDVKAIIQFQWQLKHPGKFSPFGFGNSTGATVRVTVDNPERKEQILREYAYNGKLYVNAEGDLVKPSTMSEQAAGLGLVPTLQTSVDAAGDTLIKKPDGSVVKLDGTTADPATAISPFEDATLYVNDAPVRYLMLSDIKPDTVVGYLDASTPDGQAEIAAFDKALVGASPFREVAPDTLRAQTAITAVGKLDKMHAADLSSPEGIGGISLDNGKTRFNASDRAAIEILEAPAKGLMASLRRAFRGNLTEAEALKLAAAPVLGVGERLTEADRAAAAMRAEAEGRMGALAPGAAPGVGAGEDTVTVSRTDTFGNEELAEVPADSQAARVAAAAGQVVSAPTPAPAAPVAAPAPAPAAKAPTEPTVVRKAAGAGGYEYEALSDGSFRIAKSPAGNAGKIVKAGQPGFDAIKKEVDAAPAAPAAAPTAPAAKPRIPSAGPAETFALPEIEPKPEIGRRMGAATIRYGERAPGEMGPGEAAAAPSRGEAGAERRRPIRDLIERLRGRGPDEGMRAAEKAFSEEEKKAAERTKERERYGAIGEMPTARMDLLPPEVAPKPPVGEAGTEAADRALFASLAKADPDLTDAQRAGDLTREVAPPLDVVGSPANEAALRGSDESLMSFVSKKTGQGGYVAAYGDLARQYKDLQGLKQFNPSLYAQETRKLADEARRRMATPRDVQLKTSSAFPGDVLGQGPNIESETPVVRLPGSETELAMSPFLARIVEGRQARMAAPAEPANEGRASAAKAVGVAPQIAGVPTFGGVGRPASPAAAPAATPAREVDRVSLKEMTDKTAADIAKMPGAPPKVTPFTSSTRTPEERAAGATKKMKTFAQLQEEARRERTGGM